MGIKFERKKSTKSKLTFGDLAVGDMFTFPDLGEEYKNRVFMKIKSYGSIPNCVSIYHEVMGSGNMSTETSGCKVTRFDDVTLTINE